MHRIAITSPARAPLDEHLEGLLLLGGLLALARRASVRVWDHRARSFARGTSDLLLLDHARADLSDDHSVTGSGAIAAFGGSAGFGALSCARDADHVLRKSQLLGHAVVEVVEGDLERENDILALALAATAAAGAASEDVEKIDATATAAGVPVLDGLLATLVVKLPLLFVLEHLVRLLHLFEKLCIAGWLVWMILHRKLSE